MRPIDLISALSIVLIWGLSFVAIKVGLRDMPPFLLCTARFLLSAVPAIFFFKRPAVPWHFIVAYGLALGVLQFGLLFTAMKLGMPAGLSSLVMQAQAFFTIFLAMFFLRETMTRFQLIGSLIAAIGLLALGSTFWHAGVLIPFLFTLSAAGFWGLANLATKLAQRHAQANAVPLNMLGFVVWGSLVATPFLLGLSFVFEGAAEIGASLQHIHWVTVAALLYLAYPSTILAFGLYNRLLARYPAAQVTPFTLLVPFSGVLGSTLLLNETISSPQLFAASVVIAGLAVNVLGGPTWAAWVKWRRVA